MSKRKHQSTEKPPKTINKENGSRTWVFTLNNPTEKLDWEILKEKAKYLVYQLEQGEKEETPHYQGYIEMSKVKRLTGMKKIIPKAHFEKRRGTRDEARNYCMKTDTRVEGPWEYGEFKGKQGFRSDAYRMKDIQDKLDKGATMKQISKDHFGEWTRHNKAFEKYQLIHAKKRDFKSEIYVAWGPRGTGKSRWCRDQTRDKPNVGDEAYWIDEAKGLSGEWWDGYGEHENQDVVFDEFHGGWMKYTRLLKATDENPMQVETKGGKVNFAPKRIFFTSNTDPGHWYKSQFGEFERRVTKWLAFTGYKEWIEGSSYQEVQEKLGLWKPISGPAEAVNNRSEWISADEFTKLREENELLRARIRQLEDKYEPEAKKQKLQE